MTAVTDRAARAERNQAVEITVPVKIEGCLAFEFEAAVDIHVTYWGCPAFTSGPPELCYPAEGPEWEVTSHYVDCGSFDRILKRWRPDLRPAPDWAVKLIDAYLDTREADEFIAEHIMENAA